MLAGAATMGVAGLNGASVYAVVDAGLQRPPAFAGVLYVVQGIGSVVIGLFAGALLRRMPERVFAAAGIMLFAMGVALRVVPSVPVVLLARAMIGAGLPCVLIAALTAVQRETPGQLVGRVAATVNTPLFAPNAIALAAGAVLLALVDHCALLLAAEPQQRSPRSAASLVVARGHRQQAPRREGQRASRTRTPKGQKPPTNLAKSAAFERWMR